MRSWRGARGLERGGDGGDNGVLECWSNGRNRLRDNVRREGAFGAGVRKDHAASDRSQGAPNAGRIFVTQSRQNDRGALVAELPRQVSARTAEPPRVMRAVDDDSFVPPLKTCGPMNIRQTSSNRSLADHDSAEL